MELKLKLKKTSVMQLSDDIEQIPQSQTNEIAGGGTNGCTGTAECEHTGLCWTSDYRCRNTQYQGCTN